MDIPGLNIQLPQANQAVKPQNATKSFQDVLEQTSSPAGMDNTISTQKTTEIKQDLPVEKTRDTQVRGRPGGLQRYRERRRQGAENGGVPKVSEKSVPSAPGTARGQRLFEQYRSVG